MPSRPRVIIIPPGPGGGGFSNTQDFSNTNVGIDLAPLMQFFALKKQAGQEQRARGDAAEQKLLQDVQKSEQIKKTRETAQFLEKSTGIPADQLFNLSQNQPTVFNQLAEKFFTNEATGITTGRALNAVQQEGNITADDIFTGGTRQEVGPDGRVREKKLSPSVSLPTKFANLLAAVNSGEVSPQVFSLKTFADPLQQFIGEKPIEQQARELQILTRAQQEVTPPSQTNIEKRLIAEGLEPGSPEFRQALKDFREKSAKTEVNVDIAEKSMTKLAEKMSEQLVTKRENAIGARNALNNIQEAKQLLDSGVITGSGAEFITGLGNFVQSRFGFDLGDPVANTQAFAATMGNQVGQIIKQFGAGTGLSDADREYAKQIAGGDITLDEKAIRRIIKINEKANRNVLKEFNKLAEQAMKRPGAEALPFDLRVEIPDLDGQSNDGLSAIDSQIQKLEQEIKALEGR